MAAGWQHSVTIPGEVLSGACPDSATCRGGRTRDPWAILVSEVMLQQTQVPRVIPKWQQFIGASTRRPAACAAASLGDVSAALAGTRLSAPGEEPARRSGADRRHG